MNLFRIVVAIEYVGTSEGGYAEWAAIREKFTGMGVKVIEPPTVMQEIREESCRESQ